MWGKHNRKSVHKCSCSLYTSTSKPDCWLLPGTMISRYWLHPFFFFLSFILVATCWYFYHSFGRNDAALVEYLLLAFFNPPMSWCADRIWFLTRQRSVGRRLLPQLNANQTGTELPPTTYTPCCILLYRLWQIDRTQRRTPIGWRGFITICVLKEWMNSVKAGLWSPVEGLATGSKSGIWSPAVFQLS